jgi:predicted lactoylglutathione lyase
MIFVNLPVSDVQRSRRFFTALGFEINEQFSGEHSVCVIFADNIFAMLLSHEHFQGFTPRPIADATQGTEVLLALSCESRAEADALVENAIAAGGSEPRAVQDLGWMYSRAFADPDGHIWEVAWMGEMPADEAAAGVV